MELHGRGMGTYSTMEAIDMSVSEQGPVIVHSVVLLHIAAHTCIHV